MLINMAFTKEKFGFFLFILQSFMIELEVIKCIYYNQIILIKSLFNTWKHVDTALTTSSV